MNRVSQVSLMHQHTKSKERLSSSVLTKMNSSKPDLTKMNFSKPDLTKMNFSKPDLTKMNFQNSNKSLLVSDRTLQL